MEPSIEVFQFFMQKNKQGLILFGSDEELRRWNFSHGRFMLNNFCYWIPTMHIWRFEGTIVRLASLEDERDLMKLKGITFDRVWFVNVESSLARIAVGALRLPLNQTPNNQKVLTDGSSTHS